MGATPQRDYAGEVLDLCNAAGAVKEVSAENEGQVADLGKAVSILSRELDAARKEENKPHNEKLAAIATTYNPLLKSLDKALEYLKARVADWMLVKIKAQEAEKRRIEDADRARQKAVKEAEEAGDVPPEAPAIREIAPPPPSNISRGSFGKAVGRKVWKAEMTDMVKLCQAIIDGAVPEDLLEFQTQKAVSLARGGIKFDPETVGIRAWQQSDQTFN